MFLGLYMKALLKKISPIVFYFVFSNMYKKSYYGEVWSEHDMHLIEKKNNKSKPFSLRLSLLSCVNHTVVDRLFVWDLSMFHSKATFVSDYYIRTFQRRIHTSVCSTVHYWVASEWMWSALRPRGEKPNPPSPRCHIPKHLNGEVIIMEMRASTPLLPRKEEDALQ